VLSFLHPPTALLVLKSKSHPDVSLPILHLYICLTNICIYRNIRMHAFVYSNWPRAELPPSAQRPPRFEVQKSSRRFSTDEIYLYICLYIYIYTYIYMFIYIYIWIDAWPSSSTHLVPSSLHPPTALLVLKSRNLPDVSRRIRAGDLCGRWYPRFCDGDRQLANDVPRSYLLEKESVSKVACPERVYLILMSSLFFRSLRTMMPEIRWRRSTTGKWRTPILYIRNALRQ